MIQSAVVVLVVVLVLVWLSPSVVRSWARIYFEEKHRALTAYIGIGMEGRKEE